MSTELPENTDPDFVDTDAEDSDIEDTDAEYIDDGVLYDDEVTPEYGILGFTLRELLIVGAWALLFIVSFFPLGWSGSLWEQGISWILPVGAPTAAVFLLVLRRFSPDGIRRVGSLGIDQFASVTFSVAAIWWAQQLWQYVSVILGVGSDAIVWVPWVQLVLSLALVVFTVFAPIVPGLKEDFHGRLVTLAHRNANPVRPVIPRPQPERVAVEPGTSAAAGSQAQPIDDVDPDATSVVPTSGFPTSAFPTSVAPPVAGQTTERSSATSSNAPVPSATSSSPEQVDVAHPSEPEASAPEIEAPPVGQDVPVVVVDDAAPMADSETRQLPQLDVELSDLETTDQFARGDLAPRIGLAEHASGGGTGNSDAAADEDYTPSYSRRSRGQEIAYDTDSILELVTPDPDPEPAVGHRGPDNDVETTRPREAVLDAQPFWILAGTERDVHDERGEVLFRIGPSAWTLVIEDRGGAYVVRHDDGRIGYLHDITNITRG
ncbi:hypothetical protein ACI3KS_04615 [Microbacterium sp. ZW T5_45]|uniref:hypothetical protein n=1 Tax=Microbacterium sp. ZW T5_45 TaxID=3378080 RepID=UPI003853F022